MPAASACSRISRRREPQLGRVGGPNGVLRDRGPRAAAARAICGVRGDVLALAEERLVEGALEGPQAGLAPAPRDRQRAEGWSGADSEAGGSRFPARALAGTPSGSSRCEGGRRAARAAAWAPAAARTEAIRPRARPGPRPPRRRATRGTSTGRRRRNRRRHSARRELIYSLAGWSAALPRRSRASASGNATSRGASPGSRTPLPPDASCSSCPSARRAATCSRARRRRRAFAEEIPGPSVEALSKACARHGFHCVAGLLERDGDRLRNTAVLIGPAGLVGRYRKTHLPFLGVDRFVAARRRAVRGLRHAGRPHRDESSATSSASPSRPGRSPSAARRWWCTRPTGRPQFGRSPTS